jgi:pyridoxal 5'-phosphate synthase pdxS subunit
MARQRTLSKDMTVKIGLAEMLKGGVIMDVTSAEQARIAEDAGAVAVMALERIPADIRAQGGVARMSAVEMIEAIMAAVSIPVMAKCRIGHFVEAEILEALGVDFVDESEVLTPADEQCHVWKRDFQVPFVCGATSLAEAARRVGEGAAMIRSKGEAGTGNIVEATRHMRAIQSGMRALVGMRPEEIAARAKADGAPAEVYLEVARRGGRLPVPLFAAGGVATPADAALMMRLGAETVFVGSGIFKSEDPADRAKAIVHAVTFHQDPKELIAASRKARGAAMSGLDVRKLEPEELLAGRGW